MSSSTALVAISKKGAELALALSGLTGEQTVFLERRWHVEGKGYQAFDLPLRPVIQRLFDEYQRLVLFMPLGAAVRLLAPYIQDKHDDPAVVCVDDAGRFAVSLLSGHLGGADALAQEVAMLLGATPVVTSASHVAGTLAVDLLGQEFGWVIDSPRLAVTRASAAVVNGEPVGVYQQAGEPDWWPEDRPLPKNIIRCSDPVELADAPGDAALIISDYLNVVDSGDQPPEQVLKKQHLVVYRPRSLVIGMGCRRGAAAGQGGQRPARHPVIRARDAGRGPAVAPHSHPPCRRRRDRVRAGWGAAGDRTRSGSDRGGIEPSDRG